MSTIQTAEWRTGVDGTYKVFIRGCEQIEGSVPEVISCAGKSTYTIVTGTDSKVCGGTYIHIGTHGSHNRNRNHQLHLWMYHK